MDKMKEVLLQNYFNCSYEVSLGESGDWTFRCNLNIDSGASLALCQYKEQVTTASIEGGPI